MKFYVEENPTLETIKKNLMIQHENISSYSIERENEIFKANIEITGDLADPLIGMKYFQAN